MKAFFSLNFLFGLNLLSLYYMDRAIMRRLKEKHVLKKKQVLKEPPTRGLFQNLKARKLFLTTLFFWNNSRPHQYCRLSCHSIFFFQLFIDLMIKFRPIFGLLANRAEFVWLHFASVLIFILVSFLKRFTILWRRSF